MIQAYLSNISIAAPGLSDWTSARAILRGECCYAPSELPPYQANLLPANERRRASLIVRLAFHVAEASTAGLPREEIAALASVFSSSDGDLHIAQRICSALAMAPRFISPTDFHNSVHNAAAGYWSIAAQAKGPTTAIAASDYSFAIGLLEALGLVTVEHHPTLLLAYDIPGPAPLHAKQPLSASVGVGLLLTPKQRANSYAMLTAQATDKAMTEMPDAALESLRRGNPAARALPLLALLAAEQSGTVSLPLNAQQTLTVSVRVL